MPSLQRRGMILRVGCRVTMLYCRGGMTRRRVGSISRDSWSMVSFFRRVDQNGVPRWNPVVYCPNVWTYQTDEAVRIQLRRGDRTPEASRPCKFGGERHAPVLCICWFAPPHPPSILTLPGLCNILGMFSLEET